MKNIIVYLLIIIIGLPVLSQINNVIYSGKAELLNYIDSEASHLGDTVQIRVNEPINLRDQRIFIPEGATILAEISSIRSAERLLKKGELNISLRSVHYPNGYVLPITGYVNTSDTPRKRLFHKEEPEYYVPEQFITEEERQKQYELTSNTTIKAKNESIKNKLARLGKITTGAIVGGPIGAGIAGASTLFDRGSDIHLEKGSLVQIYISNIGQGNMGFFLN